MHLVQRRPRPSRFPRIHHISCKDQARNLSVSAIVYSTHLDRSVRTLGRNLVQQEPRENPLKNVERSDLQDMVEQVFKLPSTTMAAWFPHFKERAHSRVCRGLIVDVLDQLKDCQETIPIIHFLVEVPICLGCRIGKSRSRSRICCSSEGVKTATRGSSR